MKAMIIVFAAALAVSGCARDLSPDVYSRDEVGSKVDIQDARVISERNVRIEGTRSGVGAVAGAAAGGIGGSYAGRGRGGAIGAIAGAVIGGLLGAAMEGAVTGSEGVEYLVELDNGETVAVVQPKGSDPLKPGDSALLVYGHHIRVVPAEAHGNVRRKDVREDTPEPNKSWSRKEAEA
jgi:outer membrane lipoprotein SlyB